MLERLLREIQAESEPIRRSCLEARCALVRVRAGERDQAGEEVRRLRDRWMGREVAELAAWLCLVDGVLLWQDPAGDVAGRAMAAADRWRRALALAAGAPQSEVGPLALAWLADVELAQGRPLDALGLAAQGLALGHAPDHDALCRLALVVADAWMEADDPEAAGEWYTRARSQAGQTQDRLAQGETLHRMAVQRVNAVCRGAARRTSEPWRSAAGLATAMLDSADHYARLIRAPGLDHLQALRDQARQRLQGWQSRYDDRLSAPPSTTDPVPASLRAALVGHRLDTDSWKHLYDL